MNTFTKILKHLNVVNKHRFLVFKMCFKCGMYRQGLVHDLSKYSLTEFIPSVKYFQGFQSPVGKEKELKGYSEAWLHHKGRNKHHWEYWIDRKSRQVEIFVFPMPFEYMLESTIDRISASKTYNKEKYTEASTYDFFLNSIEINSMNPQTVKEIAHLLKYLKENGEEKALKYYKSLYKQYKSTKINPLSELIEH